MTRAENEREDAGNLFGKPVNWVRRRWVYSKTVNTEAVRDKCRYYRFKRARSAGMSEFVDKDDANAAQNSPFQHLTI